MDNKVVARFLDGRMIKGTTSNFAPTKDRFHVMTEDGAINEVFVADLKAVFFVRDLAGSRKYHGRRSFDGAKGFGRKVRVELVDDEVIWGFGQSIDTSRPGFFLIPPDPQDNNQRVFVVSTAVRRVSFEA